MTSSSNLSLPYILASQAQKHVTHNEALRVLDALVHLAVVDKDAAAPPSSPAEGVRFIVPANASGVWSGRTGSIAAWQDGAWLYYLPKEGHIAWVSDEDQFYVFDGASWAPQAAGGSPTMLGVNATADTTNRLSVKSNAILFSHDDVTPGTGDLRIAINKSSVGKTASYLFQTGYSGRAELGLTGDDNLHFKVSADGSTWKDAILIDRSTGAVSMPYSALGSASTPNPNLIINGDFQINQRGFGGGALAAGAFGYDRWKGDTGGANCSVSGYVVTLSSGTLVQVIETALWGLATFASTAVTISVDTPSADLLITLGSVSGTITAGAGRRSVTLTPGAGDTGNLACKIAAASSGTVTFGRIKMELGSIATPWAARDRTTELQHCQRYFWRCGGRGTYDVIGQGGTAALGTVRAFCDIRHPVEMRATPTLAVPNVQGFTILAAASTYATTDVVLHGGVNNGPQRATIVVFASGMTAGQFALIYSNGAAANYLDWSAEL